MLRRGLLLDRDGVINVDHGYIGTPAKFEFMPGLFDFLHAAQDLGLRLAILTNQSGVARGFFSEADYQDLTRWMLGQLWEEGIAIDLVLSSFVHPDSTIELYRRDSFWRKPNPGMVLEAARRLQLDLGRSAFLGDQLRDMQAGLAAGVKQCLWLTTVKQPAPAGVTLVRNFDMALDRLRAMESTAPSAGTAARIADA